MQKNKRALESMVPEFVQQVGRGASKRDPNDRHYSRKVERLVKRMDPKELAELLGQLGVDDSQPDSEPSEGEPA
jgi:hypothetical protein